MVWGGGAWTLRGGFSAGVRESRNRSSPMRPLVPPRAPSIALKPAFVQVIAHFVWRFYCMLPRSAEEARFVQHIADLQSQHVLAV